MERSNFIPVVGEPVLSNAPDKKLRVSIEGDQVYCRECTRCLGNIERGNMRSGEMVLINRTVFRCRSCQTKNVWIPMRA